MIEGLQKPDSGTILINGKSWDKNRDELHHLMGISLQETRYIDKLTVFETLRLFGSFYGLGRERAEEVLHLTGLDDKRKAYTVNISGGQQPSNARFPTKRWGMWFTGSMSAPGMKPSSC
ncbi:MAG: ATP-binding cassette domain-containing protein [Bacteroidetes bacterium]|nr:ATP-binding cassette domain-containing protein [Bacteroidota bacterium]